MKVEGMTQEVINKITDIWPDIAPMWIKELPQLLDYCKERWQLTYDKPFPGLSYHYVIPARDGLGRDVVLKSGIPGESFTREVEVLKFVDGKGMVQLHDYDTYLGLMLQERISPGKSLAYDDHAASCVAQVMRDYWRPCEDTEKFISVEEWLRGYRNFDEYEADIENTEVIALVKRAREVADSLIATMGERVILHGDLHHENVLSHEEGWNAIDPKGLVGEREYEPGTFLRNPFWDTSYHPEFERIVSRNLTILSEELELDKFRIMQWTYVQAVLALIWVYEDHDRISTEMFDISLKMEKLLETMSN